MSIPQLIPTSLRVFPVRLLPDMDVLSTIRNLIIENNLQAVFILTCVGSIKSGRLRLANSTDTIDLNKSHEIVSLVGTIDQQSEHLHGSFSDEKGSVIGGHVMSDVEMRVFTTVEIVLAECENVVFSREFCSRSGYLELVITKKIEQ